MLSARTSFRELLSMGRVVMLETHTPWISSALCDLSSIGGVETMHYPAGYVGRKWSIQPPPEIAEQMFGYRVPNPEATSVVAMVDPDAPLVTGGPVIISIGQANVFGRLETKHPKKVKWLSVTIPTINGSRFLRNFCEPWRATPIVGVCQLKTLQ